MSFRFLMTLARGPVDPPGHPTRAALGRVMAFPPPNGCGRDRAAYQTSPSRQSQMSSPEVSSGTASSNT